MIRQIGARVGIQRLCRALKCLVGVTIVSLCVIRLIRQHCIDTGRASDITPFDGDTGERISDRDLYHGRFAVRAMPVKAARRYLHDIPLVQSLCRKSVDLHIARSPGHDQYLTERMSMPLGVCARRELRGHEAMTFQGCRTECRFDRGFANQTAGRVLAGGVGKIE